MVLGAVKFVDPDKNSLIATGKGIYQLGKSAVAGVNWIADKTGAWDEPEWSKQQRKGIRDGFNAIDWSDPEMYGEVVGSIVGGGAITKVGKLSVLGNIGKAEAAVISTADEAAVIATKSADDLAAAGASVVAEEIISEKIGSFYLRGSKKLKDGTYTRTIQTLANLGEQSLFDLVKAIEIEARSMGANKIVIKGIEIVEERLINEGGARLLGYDFLQTSPNSIELTKVLK